VHQRRGGRRLSRRTADPRFLVAAATVWLIAVATAVAVLVAADGAPGLWARWLGRHGGPEYPLWIGWVLAAPVVLAVAALVPRDPWPWVVASSVHVLATASAVARVAHLAPPWAWILLAVLTVAGMVSIVSASGRRGPVASADATGS
jgi:hypothetical protein